MKTRHQRGYLYRKSGSWYLRYYETTPSGERIQTARRLAHAADCKTKTAARSLADEFLKPFNDGQGSLSSITLTKFVQSTYFPCVESQKRASTAAGYRSLWKRYLVSQICDIQLRDFRTADAERILEQIAGKFDLSSTTLGHIKAFLSGIFRHAKRQGMLIGENPMREAGIPKSRGAGETHAYSLDEIQRMLEILEEPAATIVACAAFTGARKGELRGFSWEDYDGKEIRISRAYWRDTVAEPKTSRSKAPVPVVPQLAARLNLHRDRAGNPASGLMFPAEHKKNVILPIDLDGLARNVITPALSKHGLKWHGWHAFRRGLATNLHHLGVQDKVIQRILRHSNVSVTQACYIKPIDGDVAAAMEKLAAVSG